jgi:hypothetical protein
MPKLTVKSENNFKLYQSGVITIVSLSTPRGGYTFTATNGTYNTTATTGATNFVKALGTTHTQDGLVDFTHSGSNRLTYTGTQTVTKHINIWTTIQNTTNNSTVTVALAVNGVVDTQTAVPFLCKNANEFFAPSPIIVNYTLSTGQFLEIWIRSTSGNPTLSGGGITIF